MSVPSVADVVQGEGPRQRRAIAKSITLLESTRADHRAQGDELLTALLPYTGNSLRIGISGVPGVGKSTFIESLGVYLIERGHRVAVLAIDPSSTVSGGSILGDKTRMERLSREPLAFIRPSPACLRPSSAFHPLLIRRPAAAKASGSGRAAAVRPGSPRADESRRTPNGPDPASASRRCPRRA